MEETRTEPEAPEVALVIESVPKDGLALKLLSDLLSGRIVNIKPNLDFTAEMGFNYPAVEGLLGTRSSELVPVLKSLAEKGILKREFFERLLRCPRCKSVNLRPSTHCTKCGSGNIVRGRVLEHSVCKYVGVEEEFTSKGSYVCPQCHVELKASGGDYQSKGLLRLCRACGEVFGAPLIKWRCLKCSTLAPEDEVGELVIHSYRLDEAKRGWLQFELQPKAKLIDFLRRQGYHVTTGARVKGRSGGEHTIDVLASRDDGVVAHDIAIGVEGGEPVIGLDRVLDFDTRAYDSGFHDKILIVIPQLGQEAQRYAGQQRIKVIQAGDLESVLTASSPRPREEISGEPFQYRSTPQFAGYMEKQGYQVKQNAQVRGRSGATHMIDILATRDEGIVTHRIAVGIRMQDEPVELEHVFRFDDKAYDAGIMDKVFVAVPGLTKEAREFALRQRIKLYEIKELETPPVPDEPESTPGQPAE